MISSRYAGHRFVLCTATDIVRWVRDQRHSPLINLMVEDSDQSYAHGSSWFQQTQEWYKHFTGLPGGLRMNIETACVLCNTLRPKQNAISEEYGSQHHNRHSWARLDIFVCFKGHGKVSTIGNVQQAFPGILSNPMIAGWDLRG